MWRTPDWACVPSLCGHLSWVWWQCCSTEIWRQDICQHSSEEQVLCSAVPFKPRPLLIENIPRQSREPSINRSMSAWLAFYSAASWAGRRSERTPGFCLWPYLPPGSKEALFLSHPHLPAGLEILPWGYYSSFQPWVMHARLQSPWETQHLSHCRYPGACSMWRWNCHWWQN